MEINYKLPSTLTQDIAKFGNLATGYRNNTVSTTEFKAFRVPMGVYEQRKNEVYMARVRATGGFITPKQLLSVIDIAQRNGSDLLHITTRAEVQILNLDLANVERVLKELQSVGLATKGGGGNTVRNILVSEFSGISPDEVFDTTPYAMALTDAVVPEADSYLMPRKMKIAFSSDENFIDYAGVNDVGLVAQIKNGKRGFKVYIGGGAGSKPSVGWLYKEFLPAEDLYALIKGMKDFFNAHGNRKDKYKARIRFIFYKLGVEETFRLIDQYVEKAKETGIQLNVKPDAYLPKVKHARTTVLPFTWGNIWLNDDSQVAKLRTIIEYADKLGDHTIRFTPKQNIRFRNIPQESFAQLEQLLADFTPSYGKPAVLGNIVSCTGADTCRLGICLSKGLANAIYDALEKNNLDLDLLADARINISGCPNLCGQPLWADLGFVGKVLHTDHVYPAYQIYIGADYTASPQLAQSIGSIAAYDTPRFVVDLVRRFTEIADTAESLSLEISFGKWLRSNGGRKAAEEIVARYADVPLFTEDKNYYFDWGSNDLFNVTKRGKPECSAGLFDMIAVDKDEIAAARKRAEAGDAKATYDIVFHASRMLLVTRGLDPQDATGVFRAFTEQFIDTGYVAESYRSLIDDAKGIAESGKLEEKNSILSSQLSIAQANALADAVITLYESMDDALQFRPSPRSLQGGEPEGEGKSSYTGGLGHSDSLSTEEGGGKDRDSLPTRTKDLRGVLCPMNFVRTKLELATLKSGDTLEILLDDGKPIENVPGSVRLEGHAILSQTQHSEGYWQVIIQKK